MPKCWAGSLPDPLPAHLMQPQSLSTWPLPAHLAWPFLTPHCHEPISPKLLDIIQCGAQEPGAQGRHCIFHVLFLCSKHSALCCLSNKLLFILQNPTSMSPSSPDPPLTPASWVFLPLSTYPTGASSNWVLIHVQCPPLPRWGFVPGTGHILSPWAPPASCHSLLSHPCSHGPCRPQFLSPHPGKPHWF